MAGLPAGGAMIAVAAGENDVLPLLTDGVAIAAVNAPNSVVLSGAKAPVRAVAERLSRQGARVHRLAVSHAFHSGLVEPMIDEFANLVAEIKADEPRIGLISNVTGQLAGRDYGSAQYWAEHVRRPVRFVDGVRLAEALGANIFAEVGPAAGLSAAVEQSLTREHATAVPTLVDERPEIDALLTAAGQLFAHGSTIDWPSVLSGLGGRRVELPTYGFARQRFWLGKRADSPAPLIDRAADLAERLHALAPRTSSGSCWNWCARMRQRCWGTRAVAISTSSAPFPISALNR